MKQQDWLDELAYSYTQTDEALDRALAYSHVKLLQAWGYDFHSFLSHSKGKGRKRHRPVEVELYKRSGIWHKMPSDGKGPFDQLATELHLDENEFVNSLRKCAKTY